MAKNTDMVPIEVSILTVDHDIKGVVYVSKYTNTNRELTDLLNDRERRFLAVTNAEIFPRNAGQSPRKYNFLEIHMDYVLMGSSVDTGCVLKIREKHRKISHVSET